jgi:C-terminal processing protease CtpA/Prc
MRDNRKCPRRSSAVPAGIVICLFALAWAGAAARAQSIGFDRDRGRAMLGQIKSDIKKNYYDPTFRGVDLDARFRQAEEEIKQATTLGQITGAIAQALLDLNDSHTFFIPPAQATRADYGWQMQIVGADCMVVAVKPGSDAQAKGLKPGDRVLSINSFKPTRSELWKMKYYYNVLSPQTGLSLVVQSPGAQPRKLDIAAKVRTDKVIVGESVNDWFDMEREYQNDLRLNSHRYYEAGDDLIVWKMPAFDLPVEKVDDIMGKARKRKALILDLRGNGGGREDTMLRMVGHFFDRELKVGEIRRRSESRPLVAKSRGDQVFKGRLVVLTDSESGSAAEVFARVVQLEKRGTVVGDRTAGAVMRGKVYMHQLGADRAIFYGSIITDADLVMSDGKSLEHTGVVPDELILPMGEGLAAGSDPVLSYAASLVGVKLSPAQAGALFPVRWKE